MRLLKVACADFTAGNLSSDSKYGSHTSVSIIQSVYQVEIAWPATPPADGQLPGELRLSSGCERADLFMPDLNPGNALVAAQGVNNAVQRISGHAIDSLYSDLNKCFDNHLGYGWHIFSLPNGSGLGFSACRMIIILLTAMFPPVCPARVLYCDLQRKRGVILNQDIPHIPGSSRSIEEGIHLSLFFSWEPWRPFCELRTDQSQSLAPGFSQPL